MNKLILAVVLCAALPVRVALAQAPAPAPAPKVAAAPVVPAPSQLSLKDFMHHVINPAAEGYWAHSGEADAADRTPTDDATWQEEYDHAAAIQEAGNQLLADGHRLDDPVWIRNANKLVQGGKDGIKASIAKDATAGFEAGSEMSEGCFGCHGKYIKATPLP
jgi:hypothetical protein